MKVKPLLRGVASYVLPSLGSNKDSTGGATNSARYCYSVWLRHLVMAHNNKLSTNPKRIAELGPGYSIGAGLAALISGAEKYYAFDVDQYANIQTNIQVFDELVTLFKNKKAIPDKNEFPKVTPYLNSYKFPDEILTDDRLNVALNDRRIERIRNSLIKMNEDESVICYVAPWFDSNIIEKESIDMIFSQTVLQHIDDLDHTYKTLYAWLKSTGFMSHTIDFKSMGITSEWNGHWLYSDFTWKLIKGKRPYLINREPHSTHLRLLKQTGFNKVCDIKIESPSKISKDNLAPRFRNMSEDDLITSGTFIQASK